MPAIDAQGLVRRFGDGITAVDGLDLQIRRGEMFGLVGPDGAGKSTAIRLLCGLLKPDAGSASILGLDLVRDHHALKSRIGYLSQNYTLYGDLTLDENLEFFADLHGVDNMRSRRDRLLEMTGLTPFRQRLSQHLSGGMKKKLALACTLIHSPELIFLDEPSTGVDPVSRGEFWNILSDMVHDGMTVLMTTPYLDEAERCDRIAVMHRGRVQVTDLPATIRKSLPGGMLAIQCDSPAGAYRLLRNRWPSSHLVVHGGSVRLWSREPGRESEEAGRLLAGAGLSPVVIRPVEPSLEDACVALVTGEDVAASESSCDSALEAAHPGVALSVARASLLQQGDVPNEEGRGSAVAVEIETLGKTFGDFQAVRDLSLTIQRGEIFGLLGPNGAGKSTTIRMLCGLLASTEGTARVAGFDINRQPERVRENIGYMAQRFSLYADLTARENLRFSGGVYGLGGARLRSRIDEVLDLVELTDAADRLAGGLSGAVQQRLALAAAILHDPAILFLDEPTSGVDPISRRRFWDLIRGFSDRGGAVLTTTHFMDEAEFCGRVGFISSGRLMALGPPAELRHTAVDEDLFEVRVEAGTRARLHLATVSGVRATSYFGPRLHVFAARGSQTPEALMASLRQAGFEPGDVAAIPFSLEDVFVRLAQKATGSGPS